MSLEPVYFKHISRLYIFQGCIFQGYIYFKTVYFQPGGIEENEDPLWILTS